MSLNGVLWTGGGALFFENGKLTPFASSAYTILNTVRELNANGTYMPLWGESLWFTVASAGVSTAILTSPPLLSSQPLASASRC